VQQPNIQEDQLAYQGYLQANINPPMQPGAAVLDQYGQSIGQNWAGMSID
jgi:hypothetical protein